MGQALGACEAHTRRSTLSEFRITGTIGKKKNRFLHTLFNHSLIQMNFIVRNGCIMWSLQTISTWSTSKKTFNVHGLKPGEWLGRCFRKDLRLSFIVHWTNKFPSFQPGFRQRSEHKRKYKHKSPYKHWQTRAHAQRSKFFFYYYTKKYNNGTNLFVLWDIKFHS